MSVSIVAIKEDYKIFRVPAKTCIMNITFSKDELAVSKFIVECIILNDGNIMVNLSVFMIAPKTREVTDDESLRIGFAIRECSNGLKRELQKEKTQYQDILNMLKRVGIQTKSKKIATEISTLFLRTTQECNTHEKDLQNTKIIHKKRRCC